LNKFSLNSLPLAIALLSAVALPHTAHAQATAATFSVSATPAATTLEPGGTVNYQVTVTGSGGFTGPVTLSTGGQAPVPAYVTFSPHGLTLQTGLVTAGAQPVMANLTLTSQQVITPATQARRFAVPALAGGLSLALLVWPFRRSGVRWPAVLFSMLLCTFALNGCGSSNKQTYDLVIVGTSGQVTETTTVTVAIAN
jgi:hypothetical protein